PRLILIFKTILKNKNKDLNTLEPPTPNLDWNLLRGIKGNTFGCRKMKTLKKQTLIALNSGTCWG
ncbi:TPA: hypothetical protein ACHVIE_002323, partial [Streptococcus suis]